MDKLKHKIERSFETHLNANYVPNLVRILLEEETNVHYALTVDASHLLKEHGSIADVLFFKPEETLPLLNDIAKCVMENIFSQHMLKSHMVLKQHVHVRFTKLPVCAEIWRDRIPKSKDIGCFLAVEGTVIRTNSVKILEYEKEYMCMKCHNTFTLKTDLQLHHQPVIPFHCPVDADCKSKKFVAVTNTQNKKCKDYQEVKIQEQVRKLSMGTIPRSITVILEDDLVDSCKAGDDIVVVGFVTCRWNPLTVGKVCDVEMILKANSVEVWNEKNSLKNSADSLDVNGGFECFWAAHSETPMTARNHILASLCPQLYGLYVVKLAVALMLAGGVQRMSSSGSPVRGECHLLLVGDPGTGKSQFLKYVAKITPRSVITTGVGSSAAGLTVCAIRDGPHWSLEAGALVLADGGICCIDEFSSIKDHDRAAIHEAMEQQTISVAKAGLVSKLHTRTSIFAATNPKFGKYDEQSSVSMNIAVASPLLSRFDLVIVLLDTKNFEWDKMVCNYLLHDNAASSDSETNNIWDLEQMQAYFGLIRQLNPVVSPEADKVLQAYYHAHRQSNFRNKARTTIRLLESLIRLSEAHARLMFREVVTILDAVATVTVMESSMQGCSLLPTGSILHSCFPDSPEEEYKKHAKMVLHHLKLDSLVCEIDAAEQIGNAAPKSAPGPSFDNNSGFNADDGGVMNKENNSITLGSSSPDITPFKINNGNDKSGIDKLNAKFTCEGIDDFLSMDENEFILSEKQNISQCEKSKSPNSEASNQKPTSTTVNEGSTKTRMNKVNSQFSCESLFDDFLFMDEDIFSEKQNFSQCKKSDPARSKTSDHTPQEKLAKPTTSYVNASKVFVLDESVLDDL